MIRRGVIPNLVVSQRILDKMAAAASHYIEDETGEAMVGVVTPGTGTTGVPTIYVLDTISPDDSDTVRMLHTFQQGDDFQDEMKWWLQENWHAQREKRRGSYGNAQQAKWDVPLHHLGDWHKQPGAMIEPSGGDLMTALDWLDEDENSLDFLLAPIVTLGQTTAAQQPGAEDNFVIVPLPDGTSMRVDFWYIHRDAPLFQAIVPTIFPEDQLPGLTSYPWHLVNEKRAEMEFARFEQNRMFYSVLIYDTDDKLPLEVCIPVARMGGRNIFLIATQWNYPEAPPEVRMAPYTTMDEDKTIADVFAGWWEQSTPAPQPPGWKWTEDKHLIDYIQAVEAMMGLKPESVDASVEDDTSTMDTSPAAAEPENAGEDSA